jgi:hypothetical protein
MTIRYGLAGAALTVALLSATPAPALAAWTASTGDAEVTARASVVPVLRAPVVVVAGPAVTVEWRRTTFPAVRGYRVTRVDARTGETVNARNGCSGLLTEPVCVELGVPDGRWTYAVEAVVGANWRSERAAGDTVRVIGVERDSAPRPEPMPTGEPAESEPAGEPSAGTPDAGADAPGVTHRDG